MTGINPSGAFNSGGIISSSMFATAVNLTGLMDEKGFANAPLTGRRTPYGITADRFMFEASNCPMTEG